MTTRIIQCSCEYLWTVPATAETFTCSNCGLECTVAAHDVTDLVSVQD